MRKAYFDTSRARSICLGGDVHGHRNPPEKWLKKNTTNVHAIHIIQSVPALKGTRKKIHRVLKPYILYTDGVQI